MQTIWTMSRHETNRHFRMKTRKYFSCKSNGLQTNSKNKNIRDLCKGINEFQTGYQPKTSLVKEEMSNLYTPTVFWIGWSITPVCHYTVYTGLKLLRRQKCIQLRHQSRWHENSPIKATAYQHSVAMSTKVFWAIILLSIWKLDFHANYSRSVTC